MFMSRKIVLGVVVAGSAAACAFVIGVLIRKGVAQAAVWAAVVAALGGVIAAAAAIWILVPRPSKVRLPPELEVPDWVVGRPAELAAVVQAVTGGQPGTVGITTGLYGAGGFGKTMLARMVCADPRVRRRFRGQVYLVTIGRDVRGAAAIAAKVNDVIKVVAGEDATFTDPQLAGARLGALLDAGPRRLLVLDDVWEADQLAPFGAGGKWCARLVTTRVTELLTGRGTAVLVDQMSPEQARALLMAGLHRLDEAVVQGLLAATGRWPLLLRLVNTILADYGRVAADVPAQAARLLERLREDGPAAVDDLRGNAVGLLDVNKPQERERAVRATIGASTSLLNANDAERFAELGIFAEDEVIPLRLAACLWRATGRLDDRDDLSAAQICERLAQLALVAQATGSARGITMHDVVRDFLRAELGPQRLADLNGRLLDAVAKDLPAARPQDPALPMVGVAWWELSQEDRYLWDHLVEHLRDAGRSGYAETVASDLRWVTGRLERFGPAAPAADLATIGTPGTARMRAALVRTAHLLAPTEPTGAIVDILHSRVADDSDWRPQVVALQDNYSRPRLVNRWPLPDLADRALRRVLTGHTGPVTAVAVAPDGSWLVSGSGDGTLRIWDAATGRQRTVLKGHAGTVEAVAVAPDGSWLVSGSEDGTLRKWDAATGRQRTVLKGHAGSVGVVAVAPDGSWLASGGYDQTVQIWDTETGQQRALMGSHSGVVEALAVAPDGSWLASGSNDQTVRIWDAGTWRQRAVLEGRIGVSNTVAVAPDGSWLASGGNDWSVQIWDVASGRLEVVLQGHTGVVKGLAVAPDGSWLASASWDQTVRIWDAAARRQQTGMKRHTGAVEALAVAPDGSWLASGGNDQTVGIWDAATGRQRTVLKGHAGTVGALAVAPDGRWLASGGYDQTVRIWDTETGRQQAVLKGHARPVEAVAVAPDGRWLASGSGDRTVRLWDAAAGRQLAILEGHTDAVGALVVAPDGTWLASGSGDGTVRVWDVAVGREHFVLQGHAGSIGALALAADGSWLASGGSDLTVRIWDAATWRQRFILDGHTGAVGGLAITPDGNWLASVSKDRTVRVWHVGTRQTGALMRVDNSLRTCAWIGADVLAVGGSAGLYQFGFITGINAVAD